MPDKRNMVCFFLLMVYTALHCDRYLYSQSAMPVTFVTHSDDESDGNRKIFGEITGKIYDSKTKEPLSYVNVMVVGTVLGDVSDENGFFKITKVPIGTHKVQANFIGYNMSTVENITVLFNRPTAIDIALEEAPIISEDIVITASRREQTANLAPASVGVITADEIKNKGITTFDQAIEAAPSVQMVRSSGSNVQSVSIRGSSEVAGAGVGNRVLLLIDGRPALSPESGGALWNLVPTNSIERVEVVKGAYSSLYGSNAMGGVINVITKKPVLKPYTKVHAEYGFYDPAPSYTGYNKIGDYNTLEFSHSRKIDNFSFLIDAGRKGNDGHRESTGFEMYNVYGKGIYNFSNNRNIQISANYNWIHNEYPATWLNFLDAYSVAPWRKDDRQNRHEFSSDLYYYAIPSTSVKYSTRFYYYNNGSEYLFDRNPGNDSTNVNTGHQDIPKTAINTYRVGNVSQLDYYVGDIHYLIAGTDFQFDYTDARPADILYGKHKAVNVAGYLQDEIRLHKKFTTTVGLRYDYNTIFGDYSEGNFSPKISMVYAINDDWSVRTLLAQAYRNPSVAERYIKYESGGGISFIQDPNLKSEKLYASFELGTKFRITEYTAYDISYFYNEYKNLIAYKLVSGNLYKVLNLNRARMQGIEFNFNLYCKHYYTASFGYTYLDARDISKNAGINDIGYPSGNHELPYKVKHSFNFNSDVFYEYLAWNVNGRYNSAMKEVSIYPGSEPDAFFVANTKVSYKFQPGRMIYISVNNIFDAQYEEIERYRMPGRSYTLGTIFEF